MKKSIFLLLPLLAACAQPSDSSNSAQVKLSSPQLVAFGDSFTAGEGNPSIYDGYAYQLAMSLNMRIDDQAIGGTTIGQHGQLPTIQIYPFQPGQTVIFMAGYNDSRNFAGDPSYPAKFEAMMSQALQIFEQNKVEAYVGNCIFTNLGKYTSQNVSASDQKILDDSCSTLADITKNLIENGNFQHVHFVDTHDNIHLSDATTGADKQHPNSDGYTMIRDLFLQQIPH